jgi:hypothetical protein
MSDPAHDGFPWAVRGALAGGLGALGLAVLAVSLPGLGAPLVWNGAALLALGLLLGGEAARRRLDRLSPCFAGAGGAGLLVLGLSLALTRSAPEAGVPLLLAAVVYLFLRLGLEAGLTAVVAGAAAGSLLGDSDVGTAPLLCLFFLSIPRPAPRRWQILSLLGIGVVSAVCDQAGWFSPGLSVFLLVVAPWLLSFGSPRPWRWTMTAALLAFLWLWPDKGEELWSAEGSLALAAALLLLAVPFARKLVHEPGSSADLAALRPLLAVAVVAIASMVPLGLTPHWPWLGALLIALLLGWMASRLRSQTSGIR